MFCITGQGVENLRNCREIARTDARINIPTNCQHGNVPPMETKSKCPFLTGSTTAPLLLEIPPIAHTKNNRYFHFADNELILRRKHCIVLADKDIIVFTKIQIQMLR